MREDTIAELEERWDTNEDYLDKQSATVDELDQVDDILRQWSLEPSILLPAWQIDAP